jgi:hypothetical protein
MNWIKNLRTTDLAFFTGIIFVGVGIYKIYVPAAYIFAGLVMIVMSVLATMKGLRG